MNTDKNIRLLDRIADKTKLESKPNADTMLLLAAPERKAEVDILRQIGLDTHIRQVEKVVNDATRLQIVGDKLGRKTYYGQQIKELCISNELRITRADNFKGKLPEEVGKAILKFIEENTHTQEKNEHRSVTKTDLNIVESSFFIMTSKEYIEGQLLDNATLFYREASSSSAYSSVETHDVLVEVFSWGEPYSPTILDTLSDIFKDGQEFNYNGVTIAISLVVFIANCFCDFSFPYFWVFAYIISAFIILFSSFKTKEKLWNQLGN